MAAVLATGAGRSTGSFDVPLVCRTSVGCKGVLTAQVQPAITQVQAYESNKFVGARNEIVFSIRANVPLQSDGTMVTVKGLAPAVTWPTGNVPLVNKTNILTRAGSCSSVQACTLMMDASVMSGAIILSSVLSVTIQCQGFLQLSSIRVCADEWGKPWPQNPCAQTDTQSFTISRDLPSRCKGRPALIEVAGQGQVTVATTLEMSHQVLAGGGIAKWDATAGTLVVQVVQNLTQGSVTLTDPMSFAFSVAVQNSRTRATGVMPFIQAVTRSGIVLTGQQITRIMLAGGMTECKVGELLEAEKGQYPEGDLLAHKDIDASRQATCAMIVKPNKPPGWLVAAQITQFGLRKDETLNVYNGDSPASPLLAILTMAPNTRNDPRIFFPETLLWSTECALSFHFTSTGAATPTTPLLEGVVAASGGFSLRYFLKNPEKVNHIK
jgi:hypothetical protein